MFNDIFDVNFQRRVLERTQIILKQTHSKILSFNLCGQVKQFSSLEDAINFIDTWEQNLIDKKISESQFLTNQTSEGLRVAIKSTIELTNQLLEDGFHYVQTNKMNQDKLEVIYFLTIY